jgi:putative transposase
LIPRATYYRWLDAAETPTALRRRELTGPVKTVFDSSDGIFSHRMVHTKLTAAGVKVSVGTVAGIMAENGWAAKRLRKVFRSRRDQRPNSLEPGTPVVGHSPADPDVGFQRRIGSQIEQLPRQVG